MGRAAAAAAALLAATGAAAGRGPQVRAGELFEATEDSWHLLRKGIAVALFHDPAAAHTAKALSEWREAARQLGAERIILAAVDAAEETDLAAEHLPQGVGTPLPYYVALTDGVVSTYDGPADAVGAVAFLRRYAALLRQKGARAVSSRGDMEELRDKYGVVVVAFAEPGSAEEALWDKLAERHRTEFVAAKALGPAAAASLGYTAPAVVAFAADREAERFAGAVGDRGAAKGALPGDAVVQWARAQALPNFADADPATMNLYGTLQRPVLWAVVSEGMGGALDAATARAVQTVAAATAGDGQQRVLGLRLPAGHAPWAADLARSIAPPQGGKAGWPRIVLTAPAGGEARMWRMPLGAALGDGAALPVRQWVRDCLAGRVPHEPAPEPEHSEL